AKVPHGGGRKIDAGSAEYNTLRRWIAQGMPFDTGKEPKLATIRVFPERRRVDRKNHQQLRVVANYDDGSTGDVTRPAQYQSNALDLASVDGNGRVETQDGVGEAAVMVRYGGLVAVSRATVPLGVQVPDWQDPPSSIPTDPLVFGKLRELGLPPSEACTDAEF